MNYKITEGMYPSCCHCCGRLSYVGNGEWWHENARAASDCRLYEKINDGPAVPWNCETKPEGVSK